MIFRIPINALDPAAVIGGIEIHIEAYSQKLFATALPREKYENAPALTNREAELALELYGLLLKRQQEPNK